MSMTTYIAYGYGFELKTITTENFIKFINKHMQTVNNLSQLDNQLTSDEVKSEINRLGIFCHFAKPDEITVLDIEDMAEDFKTIEDNFGHESMFSIIALIMQAETNIEFEYQQGQSDCDSQPSIILSTAMPWRFNQTEKALTSQDDLDTILKPYVNELHIPSADIGDLGIEYYG